PRAPRSFPTRRSSDLPLAAVRLEKLGAPPPELPLRRAPHEVVTLPDQLELQRVELLRLDEHLLAHAHLPEVVQQPGVAELADLLAREAHALVGAVARAVHHDGEAHGHVRDPPRVAEGGRVALL